KTVCPLRRGRPGRQAPARRMAGMIAGSALQARARRVRSTGMGADSPGAGTLPVAAIPAIGALDPGDAQLEMPVPLGAPAFACRGVFGMLAPGADRVLAVPVRHGDAEPVLAAHRFDAEKTRLQARQLDHALGGRAVAVVDVGALGPEDHRVVRRCGQAGEGCGVHAGPPGAGCDPWRGRDNGQSAAASRRVAATNASSFCSAAPDPMAARARAMPSPIESATPATYSAAP